MNNNTQTAHDRMTNALVDALNASATDAEKVWLEADRRRNDTLSVGETMDRHQFDADKLADSVLAAAAEILAEELSAKWVEIHMDGIVIGETNAATQVEALKARVAELEAKLACASEPEITFTPGMSLEQIQAVMDGLYPKAGDA